MNNDTQDRVSAFLTCNGIENEKVSYSIFISKSSIINKISGKYENDSYAELIAILNESFKDNFRYVSKTTRWLQLDTFSPAVPS